MAEGNEAWVTLATNDSYALGALVLAQSLRRVGTTRALAVMVTPDVSPSMRTTLSQLFDAIIDVNVLDSQDSVNLALLARPDLGITFTKLHCWRLTQYTKCVFLDADTLVIQNSDELFNREEFSAAPDSGWPDCFNSGVFVYRPNMDTYARLLQFALEIGSFDGGDQGLLNLFFKDWATSDIAKHLPFVYNMIASAIYSYLPAYKQFGENVKIAHFIGAVKPWLQHFDGTTSQVRPQPGQEHQTELLQAWWDIFRSEVHRRLTPEMKGIAGIYSKLTFDAVSAAARSPEQVAYEEEMRRVAWEQGTMDYMGKDSFDNILKKIQASMAQTTRGKSPSPPKDKPAPAPAPEQPAPAQPQSQSQPEVPAAPVLEPTPASAAATPSTEVPAPVPVQEPLAAASVPQPASEVPTPAAAPAQPEPAAAAPAPEASLQPQPEAAATAPPAPEPAPATAAPPPTPAPAGKTAEEIEEALRLAERQAVEKKLTEQMRTAEQKLQEERAKAEAVAVAASPGAAPPPSQPEAPATPSPAPQPTATTAAPPPQQPQAPVAPEPAPAAAAAAQPPKAPEGAAAKPSGPPPQQPKAPPRKQTSKDKAWMVAGAVGVGVGLAAIALYAFFNGGVGAASSSSYQ